MPVFSVYSVYPVFCFLWVYPYSYVHPAITTYAHSYVEVSATKNGVRFLLPSTPMDQTMPLPNLTPDNQCTAKCKRTGNRCLRLRAWGCRTCQYHGARRPGSIKRGKDHPLYKHGMHSKEGKAEHSKHLYELSQIEELGFAIGLLVGTRTRGRKPTKPCD